MCVREGGSEGEGRHREREELTMTVAMLCLLAYLLYEHMCHSPCVKVRVWPPWILFLMPRLA